MKILLLLLIINNISGYISSPYCGIVPMDEWAETPTFRTERIQLPVPKAVIQHTVTRECNTDTECRDIVKAIRKYHIDSRNFTDIGSSFYIGGNGVVYEGAGFRFVGEHTAGFNNVSLGLSFIGDFGETLPTEDAQQAAIDLLACGVRNHQLAENFQLLGHRQLTMVLSPGQALYERIQTWRHWANITFPTGLPNNY